MKWVFGRRRRPRRASSSSTRSRDTITYATIMRLLGLKVEWQRDRAKLRDILAEVASYGMDEWSVLLPALVVGKGENIPSGSTDEGEPGGFYAWCADNGIDISDPYKLVVNEQRKVYNFLTE